MESDSEEKEEVKFTLSNDSSYDSLCGVKNSNSFQKLLHTISHEREKDLRSLRLDVQPLMTDSRREFWTTLFTQNFRIERPNSNADDLRDDLIFYVRKIESNSKIRTLKSDIEVYRKISKNQPILTDQQIDWEETVYLNIILQQFHYSVTVAVCSRTSEKEIQILKKFTQRVYASPSRRRMDSKGTEEEIVYPNIFFTLDNFDEIFADCIVRDSELVCVELVATDKYGDFCGVLFLGSIRYDALKRVYDARASLTSRFTQKMNSLGFFRGHKRVEFVRMRGPGGRGHAEMAVSKLKGAPETPDVENFPIGDFEDDDDYVNRRMSDPSNMMGKWSSFRRGMRKSRSEAENVDDLGQDGCTEVASSHPEDEIEREENYDGFLGGAFGQAWHWFKERKRAACVPLNSYLTYITLPWHQIVADVLHNKQEPVLTFDIQTKTKPELT